MTAQRGWALMCHMLQILIAIVCTYLAIRTLTAVPDANTTRVHLIPHRNASTTQTTMAAQKEARKDWQTSAYFKHLALFPPVPESTFQDFHNDITPELRAYARAVTKEELFTSQQAPPEEGTETQPYADHDDQDQLIQCTFSDLKVIIDNLESHRVFKLHDVWNQAGHIEFKIPILLLHAKKTRGMD